MTALMTLESLVLRKRASALGLCAGLLGSLCATAPAQSLLREVPAWKNAGFEDANVSGWTVAGSSNPAGRRVRGKAEPVRLMASDVAIPGPRVDSLGGDYWRVSVPATTPEIGEQGRFWYSFNAAELESGVQSPRFSLSKSKVVRRRPLLVGFLARAGGGQYIRVEARIVGRQRAVARRNIAPKETMDRVTLTIPWRLAGKQFELWFRSADGKGELAVDDFRLSNATRFEKRPKGTIRGLWGYADLHAHLFNHMAFGGHMIHGSIHSAIGLKGLMTPRARSDPKIALRDCHVTHGKAPDGRGVLTLFPEAGHDGRGYPKMAWPRFNSTAHQQCYVDWLKRAWQSGLRIVHMDVGNHRAMAELYASWHTLRVPGLQGRLLPNPPTDEWNLEAQLKAAHAFVKLPDVEPWCGVARNAREARELVASGKLAMVLGVETEDIGRLHGHVGGLLFAKVKRLKNGEWVPMDEASVRRTIAKYLGGLKDKYGLAHVFPVHTAENVFGAPALYDLKLLIGGYLLRGRSGPPWPPLSFDMKNLGRMRNAWGGGEGGEGIFARLDIQLDHIPGEYAAMRTLDTNVRKAMESIQREYWRVPPGPRLGHAHARGLTRVGEILIEELMKLGMIIDVDHMSEKGVNRTLAIAEKHKYPVVASHTAFRELAFGSWKFAGPPSIGPHAKPVVNEDESYSYKRRFRFGTSRAEALASERARSARQLERIRKLGGMIGVGTGSGAVAVSWRNRVANNCDGSSRSFAQNYLYAVEKLGGVRRSGVALGTDVNGLAGLVGPRFGPLGAAGAVGDTLRERTRKAQLETQEHGVRYKDLQQPMVRSQAEHEPLVPCRTGTRTYNFNLDGLAHYGLLPDLLQDLRNIGLTPNDLAPLFRSADHYVRMWERAEAIGRRLSTQ